MAPDLDADALATSVPATPAWTVKDVYAHVAGVCADILDGHMKGILDENATQRQVDERAHLDLPQVCQEWADRVEAFEKKLADPAGARLHTPAAVDLWTHEQDIRAALGRPLVRAEASTAFVAGMLAASFRARWAAKELPTLRIVGDHRDWVLGVGEPAATLRASDFELARMLIGRRSRAQMLAMNWEGDGEPELFVDHLHVFGPPEKDLVE
jgi:uncharacterized protein (TIGR03083 family)